MNANTHTPEPLPGETLGDRIRNRRITFGWSQAELAARIGCERESITQWEANKVRHIRPDSLFALARELDTTPEQLYNIDDSGERSAYAPSARRSKFHLEVPLLTWQNIHVPAAGTVYNRSEYTMIACPIPHSKFTFALPIETIAMSPEFSVGEIIFCDPERAPADGKYVICRAAAGAFPELRQLVIESSGARYLRAINPGWPNPIIALEDDGTIEGTVIFKGKEL